jgi:hypothetical protein
MIGVLFPSERRPLTSVESAPKAPAVDVTITSARTPLRRVTAFWTLLPPSDWYVSFATIVPPSCFQRASNACTTFLK